MPLLTDEKRIAELRKQFPTLTHTSWKELHEIEPRPNFDKHHEYLGNVVCATSSDRDFYALRCNERPGMINYSIPYRDANGKINQIFIFEKMKDTYYEHVVSSENFIPIVSDEGKFSGEWVFQAKDNQKEHQTIKPNSVNIGHKEEVLNRTTARVFTISDMKRFKEKCDDNAFVKRVEDVNTAFKAIQEMVSSGILKEANPEGLRNQLLKYSEGIKNTAQEDNSKSPLSDEQQAVLLDNQPQY